jgi:GH18 family chitinase
MVGHPITVGVDGAVHLNAKVAGGWPESELLCHAHAHDVRMLVPILADASSDKSGKYYEHLLGNATAVTRMASELLAIVTAAGWDGIEFDFEGMWEEITPENTFDFATYHVAMIRATAEIFHTSLPFSTVALTMGAADFTSPSAAVILKAYPIPSLANVADQIFVMAYDMWHGHVVCAGPNAPLPAVVASLKSFIQLGARREKLILGIPWYGCKCAQLPQNPGCTWIDSVGVLLYSCCIRCGTDEYRCNNTLQTTTLKECIGVGQPSCLVGTLENRGQGYGLGVWAVEEVLSNHSSGCTKEWSAEFSSPYVNCPAGSEPLPNGPHRFPWVGPPSAYATQTWYDVR